VLFWEVVMTESGHGLPQPLLLEKKIEKNRNLAILTLA